MKLDFKEIYDATIYEAVMTIILKDGPSLEAKVFCETQFGRCKPADEYLRATAKFNASKFMADWQKERWKRLGDTIYAVEDVSRVMISLKEHAWKIGLEESPCQFLYPSKPNLQWRALGAWEMEALKMPEPEGQNA